MKITVFINVNKHCLQTITCDYVAMFLPWGLEYSKIFGFSCTGDLRCVRALFHLPTRQRPNRTGNRLTICIAQCRLVNSFSYLTDISSRQDEIFSSFHSEIPFRTHVLQNGFSMKQITTVVFNINEILILKNPYVSYERIIFTT